MPAPSKKLEQSEEKPKESNISSIFGIKSAKRAKETEHENIGSSTPPQSSRKYENYQIELSNTPAISTKNVITLDQSGKSISSDECMILDGVTDQRADPVSTNPWIDQQKKQKELEDNQQLDPLREFKIYQQEKREQLEAKNRNEKLQKEQPVKEVLDLKRPADDAA